MSRGSVLRLFVVLCLLNSSAAFAIGFSKAQDFRAATPEELAMKSLSSSPGASAAILDWVRVDDDQNAAAAEYFRIKIFTDEGKKHGDVEISYAAGYPYNTNIVGITARTIRPDGTIVPFNGKIYDKVVFKGAGTTLRAKTFSLPDVQAGSILEYRYERRWAENLLFNTVWTLQRDIPIAHMKLTLQPYAPKLSNEYQQYFVFVGIPPGKKVETTAGVHTLELENMAPVPQEPLSPPEQAITAHVVFYYTQSRLDPALFWENHTAEQRKEIERFLKSKDAQALGRDLVAGSKDQREGLQKIYAKAQTIRNFSFESEKSSQELRKEAIDDSRNADQVLRKAAGFRHEINRLFVAMARGAGYQADAVRVATRDTSFFSKDVPDAEQVTGEIAVVTIEGKPLYLDPGTPSAPFGIVSWEKTDVPAFQISKDGVKWIEVPQHMPAEALTKRTALLHLNGEALEGTITVTFSGQEALTRRIRSSDEDDAARKKAIEDEVKAWFAEGAEIKTTEIIGLRSFEEPLKGTFEVSLPLVSRAGSRVVLPMSVFTSAAKNPFSAATRMNPIYFPHAYQVQDEVRLSLPADLAVTSLPPPVKLDSGAFTYDNELKRDGSELTFRRTLSVDAMLVDKKYYNAMRSFFSAVTTADQKPLVLTPVAQ
jgi:hypothetical protein